MRGPAQREATNQKVRASTAQAVSSQAGHSPTGPADAVSRAECWQWALSAAPGKGKCSVRFGDPLRTGRAAGRSGNNVI